MVSTVRPKASETPRSPIPTCGKPAAITADPQPANVSQNVPIASAVYFLIWSIPRLPRCAPRCGRTAEFTGIEGRGQDPGAGSCFARHPTQIGGGRPREAEVGTCDGF